MVDFFLCEVEKNPSYNVQFCRKKHHNVFYIYIQGILKSLRHVQHLSDDTCVMTAPVITPYKVIMSPLPRHKVTVIVAVTPHGNRMQCTVAMISGGTCSIFYPIFSFIKLTYIIFITFISGISKGAFYLIFRTHDHRYSEVYLRF